MGKYTIIKKFEGILRNGSCPVQVENYNILLNNDTGKNIIQIQLRNTGNKVIKSVFLDIDCYDDTKDYLMTLKENAYVGLNAAKAEAFGGKQAINADTKVIGDIAVKITKIAFTDGSVWKNENDTYLEEMATPVNSFEHFGELYDQYKRECDKEKINYTYAFTEYDEYWQCVCGQPNNNENESCFNCGAGREELKKISDRAFLEEEKEKYEEAERERLAAERRKKIEEEARLEKERQEKAEEEARLKKERQEKNKKIIKISSVILIICVVGICAGLAVNYRLKLNKYNEAVELLENESYSEAAEIFESLENFKDSKEKYGVARKEKIIDEVMSADGLGDYYTAISQLEEISDKIDVSEEISEIKNIVSDIQGENYLNNSYISAGYDYTVGLKKDGTAVAVGDNDDGQCNVDDWTDIVAVSAGSSILGHTVGLKSDGTVVAVGNNDKGQCDVDSWTDIVAVSAGDYHTVGLKSDGTVVAVGSNWYGKCNVDSWTDIVAVSAGEYHTVGLKSDGTVVAVGSNSSGQCDVEGWTDIVAISAGDDHTVGVKSDGRAVAVGSNSSGQCDVKGWTDIVAISAGNSHTVGVKSDGTAVAAGYNDDGQCNVGSWTDIVAVSAGGYHTAGLKSDGTAVAVGYNRRGQCDVSGWQNIGRSQ